MEITSIKFARTTENGQYIHPEYASNGLTATNGVIANAEPWVQRRNKQLWVDQVCINPTLTPVAVSGSQTDYNIFEVSKSIDATSKECFVRLGFNGDNFIDWLSGENKLHGLAVSYGNTLMSSALIYSPFRRNNNINLGSHISLTTNNNEYTIDSEYISQIEIMPGSSLISSGRGSGLGDINSSYNYLVVTSTLGTTHAAAISDISGSSVQEVNIHARIDPNDNLISDANPTYIEARYFDLYTNAVNNSVRIYHDNLENVTNNGTDVRFLMSSSVGSNNVKIEIVCIDGGEIPDPNAAQGSGDQNQ